MKHISRSNYGNYEFIGLYDGAAIKVNRDPHSFQHCLRRNLAIILDHVDILLMLTTWYMGD